MSSPIPAVNVTEEGSRKNLTSQRPPQTDFLSAIPNKQLYGQRNQTSAAHSGMQFSNPAVGSLEWSAARAQQRLAGFRGFEGAYGLSPRAPEQSRRAEETGGFPASRCPAPYDYRPQERGEHHPAPLAPTSVFYGSMTAAEVSQMQKQAFDVSNRENWKLETEIEQKKPRVSGMPPTTGVMPFGTATEHGAGPSNDAQTGQTIFYGSMSSEQLAHAHGVAHTHDLGFSHGHLGGHGRKRKSSSGMSGVEHQGGHSRNRNSSSGMSGIEYEAHANQSNNGQLQMFQSNGFGIPGFGRGPMMAPPVQQDSRYLGFPNANVPASQTPEKMTSAQFEEHLAEKKKVGLAGSRYA